MTAATPPPKLSNQTEFWREQDSRHHLHPFTTHRELRARGPRVITHGKGVYIWDSEGNKILDGMAGLWCVQLGYGNKALADAGCKALRELPFYNSFFQTTHPYVAELAAKIATLTPPGMNEMMFANSGSEANDSGVKLIRYFWNLKGRKTKKAIISRNRSYHGVTMAAASLSGLGGMYPQFDLPLPGFYHVSPTPHYYEYGQGLTEAEFTDACVKAVEDKILELGPENVAAFIGEPVMGAGGMMIPPAGYWPKIEALCRKYDILLWADEVICGFGRTGEWFGCQTYGFTPDIMTVAKGMSSGYQPISAVILGERMAEAIRSSDEEMAHGFTYSGHPVACAVALANIREMERLDLAGAEGKKRAAYFQAAIQTLSDHAIVGQVRGIGFLGAIELVADKATHARFPGGETGMDCRTHCFDSGLVMRAVDDTMILSPPLVISTSEIDELVKKARFALDLTAREQGRM